MLLRRLDQNDVRRWRMVSGVERSRGHAPINDWEHIGPYASFDMRIDVAKFLPDEQLVTGQHQYCHSRFDQTSKTGNAIFDELTTRIAARPGSAADSLGRISVLSVDEKGEETLSETEIENSR